MFIQKPHSMTNSTCLYSQYLFNKLSSLRCLRDHADELKYLLIIALEFFPEILYPHADFEKMVLKHMEHLGTLACLLSTIESSIFQLDACRMLLSTEFPNGDERNSFSEQHPTSRSLGPILDFNSQ